MCNPSLASNFELILVKKLGNDHDHTLLKTETDLQEIFTLDLSLSCSMQFVSSQFIFI
jgi:hypothetical protein